MKLVWVTPSRIGPGPDDSGRYPSPGDLGRAGHERQASTSQAAQPLLTIPSLVQPPAAQRWRGIDSGGRFWLLAFTLLSRLILVPSAGPRAAFLRLPLAAGTCCCPFQAILLIRELLIGGACALILLIGYVVPLSVIVSSHSCFQIPRGCGPGPARASRRDHVTLRAEGCACKSLRRSPFPAILSSRKRIDPAC